jgi:hypothetical protein
VFQEFNATCLKFRRIVDWLDRSSRACVLHAADGSFVMLSGVMYTSYQSAGGFFWHCNEEKIMSGSNSSSENKSIVKIRALGTSIASIALVISGGFLWSGALADHFSPRGTWQLKSLGFMLICLGVTGITWLCGIVAASRFLSESDYPRIYTAAERFAKRRYGIPILFGFMFFMYRETLELTFFGDDFQILSWIAQGPFRMLLPIEGIYHYFPVTLFLIGIPRWLGFGEASTYHFANIMFHSANAVLVFAIALELLKNQFEASISAVLFGLFFLAYDPVTWSLVGNHYVTSTFFALFAFLWFIRYRLNQKKWHLWGFALFYCLSIYTHEICVPLIGACFLYDLSRDGERLFTLPLATLRRILGAYVVPVTALAVLWGVKYFFTVRIVISRNDPIKLLQNFVSAACFFSPFNNMNAYWIFSRWGQNPIILAIASLAVAAIITTLCLKSNREQRTMLGWYIIFVLLPILAAELGPRYFYIAAAGWAVFWATVLTRTGMFLVRFHFGSRDTQMHDSRSLLAGLGAVLLCICIAVQGQRHAAHLVGVWRQGSKITESVVESTVELVNQHPQTEKLIVVDQPTWHRADTFYGAPLLIGSIHFTLDAVTDLDIPHVKSVRLTTDNFFDEAHPRTLPERLTAVAREPGVLVIVYEEATHRMIPYQHDPALTPRPNR